MTESPPAAPGPNPKELRSAYGKAKEELKLAKDQITSLTRRIEEAETKGKDHEALSARLATLEKERDELQGTLRSLKHEQSPEFKDKYEKPFTQAAEFAKAQVESLEVIEKPADADTGTEAVTRPAKWEDFAALYQMPLNRAIRTARAMFGDSAQTVINHLTELQRLGYARDTALKEEQSKAKERQDAEVANANRQREEIGKLWKEANDRIADRDPEYFQPDPKDKEAAEILQEGFRVADSVHNNKTLTMQQRVRLDAEIRNRAAAHPLMVYKLNKANERIGELELELAELKGAGPGTTKNPGGGEPPPPANEDMATELRRLFPKGTE